jgi:uncharacterized protein (DUF362 family)
VPRGPKIGLLINHPFRNPGTHVNPDIAIAVLKMCFDAGAGSVISLKDGPYGYWGQSSMAKELSGQIKGLIPSSGDYVTLDVAGGKSLKKADMIKELFEVDAFINVSISKHHEGTGFSCLLKNMMGAATPSTCRIFHLGHGKGGWYGDVDFLSQCVADVNLLRNPELCISDSTELVVTNGPFGPGDLIKPRKVVAGKNLVGIDAYCAGVMGLEAKDISMISKSAKHGLGEMDLGKLRIQEVEV